MITTCYGSIVQGQVDLPPVYNMISSEEGLEYRLNSFIKVDSRGWTWISSWGGGVYLYDGLKANPLEVDSVVNVYGGEVTINNIQSDFFEDSKGNVWFTSIDGLICYERKTNWLRTYQMKEDSSGHFLNGGYCLFYLENDTTLWLKAEQEIFKFSSSVPQSNLITNTKGFRFIVDTEANGKVKKIYACPWIMGNGLEQINITSENRVAVKYLISYGVPGNEDLKYNVSDVFIENDSLLWLLTNQGLIEYNPLTNLPDSSYLFSENTADYSVYGTTYQDRYLILGTRDSGVWVFDKKTKSFINNFPYNDDIPNGIPHKNIGEVTVADKEHLWLASNKEAKVSSLWLENKNNFDNPFQLLPNGTNPSVISIVEDAEGNIWCASEGDGVFQFAEDASLLKQYKYRSSQNNALLEPIKNLSIDAAGEIWAISNGTVYLMRNDNWRRVFSNNESSFFSLQHLSPKDKLLTTNEGLLWLKQNANGNWIAEGIVLEGPQVGVFHSYRSKNERSFYCCSNGSQVLKLDWKNDSLVVDALFEIGADVYSFFEPTEENKLFLATSIGPLILDVDTGEVKKIGKNTAIEGVPTYTFIEDNEQNYWLVNNSALWKVSSADSLLEVYRLADGIPSLDLNLYADQLTRKNTLWVGTETGVTIFDLDNIQPYPFTPQIALTEIRVNKSTFDAGINPSEVKELNLDYNQNALDIRALALTQYNSHLNLIKYRLLGNDNDSTWITIPTGDEISLYAPTGKNILEIKGVNANGVEGASRQIEINIDKPFWKKMWFWLLVFLFFGVVMRLIVKWKLRKQREEFERKEEIQRVLQKERKRIGDDMHEELGGELTAIQLIAKKVSKEDLNAADSKRLGEIIEHAEGSVTNIREIIWAMDDEYDNLPDLAIYLRRFVVEYLGKLDIKCKTDIAALPDAIIGGKLRSNVFRCVKEVVHNIVKHAKATEAYFSMGFDKENSILLISIKDNGRGLPTANEEKEKQFGNGLKSMQRRMADINGSIHFINDNGLCVQFRIPIELD